MTETRITHTCCVICEHFCGLEVTAQGSSIVAIKPDKANPYTWRDFCVKGATADSVRTHPLRLRSPMKRVGDRYVATSYADAVNDIAARLRVIIDRDGPNAVASHLGNPGGFHAGGAMFLAALMDAIGSTSRYWLGSTDQNAAEYVAQQMYGSWWCSLQPDIEECRCFLLIGTNPAISGMSWRGHSSDGWRRVLAAVDQGAELIIVDPRLTESANHATLHVAPLPEQDWALLLGVLHVIFMHGWAHEADCAEATGVEQLRSIALAQDLGSLSQRCGIPVETIADIARRFATASTAVCISRTGPAQGRNGSLTEWLSQALNLVTGRNDRAGCRYFNPYPVNLLTHGAAFTANVTEPSRVRGSLPVSGFYPMADLPVEITTPGSGQHRALIMSAANPVAMGPDGNALDSALAELELFVAIDLFQRESHRHAHWLIPDSHFLERDELHPLVACYHELPFVQKMQQVVPLPPGVRHAWEFLAELGAALGRPLFAGQPLTPNSIAAALLAAGGAVSFEQVESAPHGLLFGTKPLGHFHKSLATVDKRVQACPPPLERYLRLRLAECANADSQPEWPYQLISRRRSQMMNSHLVETAAQKMRHKTGGNVEVNEADALAAGIAEGDDVKVISRVGAVIARAVLTSAVRRGVVVMDHGWGSRLFDPVTGATAHHEGVNRNLLVANDDLDLLVNVPRLNGTPVRLLRIEA